MYYFCNLQRKKKSGAECHFNPTENKALLFFSSQVKLKFLSLCTSLFVASPQHGPKLSLYLHEMLHDHRDGLTKDEQNAVGVFMTSLKLCGHRCIPANAAHKQDLLKAVREVRSEDFSQS